MPKTILLCDDETHILRAAEIKLSRAGYTVQCASDGQQGWELIQQRAPDLLITDLQMPRMDGAALIRQVRQHQATRDMPILVLSAKGFEAEHCEWLADGQVVNIIAKPFSPRELVQSVNAILQPQGDPPLAAAAERAL